MAPISINGTSGISGVDGSAGTPALQGSDTNTGIAFGSDVIIGSTGGTERFRVNASGQLGIGTSTPASLLNVSGSSLGLALQVTDTSATGGVGQKISNTTNTLNFGINNSSGNAFNGGGAYGAVFDMTGAYAMAFCTNATERMRIDSAGNVLIGKTSAVHTGAGTWFETPSNPSTMPMYLNFTKSYSGARDAVNFYYNGTRVGYIQYSDSATTYSTSSDYRLKENVTAVIDGIARLQQLKPSRFNFIVEPGKTVDGFIAHEVQEVVPEAITGEKDAEDADGNPIYQGIDQSKLVPLLTAALQEAVAKIESLETRLAALEVTP